MARKKEKNKFSVSLLIIGIISGMFATFGMMCIPCIMEAYPAIGIFFAFLIALALLLGRYSLVFIAVGVLFLALGILLQLSSRNKKCG